VKESLPFRWLLKSANDNEDKKSAAMLEAFSYVGHLLLPYRATKEFMAADFFCYESNRKLKHSRKSNNEIEYSINWLHSFSR
jgi:hypothetical protein